MPDGVPRIVLLQGDITQQAVDAIVNAANSSLLGGGGVDGAIHRKGGPAIVEACRRLRAERYPGGLPTGQAVETPAGHLPARWVIHTVGPVYASSEDHSGLLRSCHVEALRVADTLGCVTVAFPAISTGVYGYPLRSGRSGKHGHASRRSGSSCSTDPPTSPSSAPSLTSASSARGYGVFPASGGWPILTPPDQASYGEIRGLFHDALRPVQP